MGMFNMRSRSQLLSQDLRDTEFFSDVTIGPDLTKLQKKEEADIKREMDTLNGQLSEEDVSKNLSWRMVGQRGERRLVKGVVRGRGEGESAVESTAGGALLPSRLQPGLGPCAQRRSLTHVSPARARARRERPGRPAGPRTPRMHTLPHWEWPRTARPPAPRGLGLRELRSAG